MRQKLSFYDFVNKSIKIHKNRYEYFEEEYTNASTKTKIKCKKHNTHFYQIPKIHLKGRTGCNQCIDEKKKSTCIEKYGVENPKQVNIFKNKAKMTNIKKFGTEYPAQSKKYKVQYKKLMLEKYGVENSFQAKDVKEKIKQTNIKKYGVENISQSEKIKEKIKQTNIKKYGVEYFTQIHISTESLKLLNDKKWLLEEHHTNKKPLYIISKNLGVSPSTVRNYLIKYDIEIKNYECSIAEREILNFIESIIYKQSIITNNRNIIPPYELDIYIPEHKLAIEYNGLFWHSEIAGKEKNYHLNKTKLCEKKGIRLIHIFEDEWRDSQQKCKDTIKHILGKSERGVYARNTIIREITWKEAKEFLDRYHLLGSGSCGNYRIGAFDKDNNLIGVMVFGHKNNEGNDKSIELKRFVTNKKNNPGLGSKMFKYAMKEKNYTEVVAFVDRRWFTGLVKDHIGFKKVGESGPSLWWTNGKERFHRRFLTKNKLSKMGYDISLSKRKILENMGYYRIWDCGKIKLLWKNA